MKRAVCSLLLGALLVASGAAWAQKFDRSAYDQLVDANSPDTIPPGTKITLQNWTQYKRFMLIWMQVAFSGKSHFHIADPPQYTLELHATGNYALPFDASATTEKYAGQTKLVPY